MAGYWMLRASFGTHWPEYLKMLAEGTFRLELKRLPPLLIGTGMITMALGLLWRSRLAWVVAVLLAAMLLSGEQVTPEWVAARLSAVSPPRPSPLMRSHRRMQGVAGTSGARLDDVTRRGPDSSSYPIGVVQNRPISIVHNRKEQPWMIHSLLPSKSPKD